MGLNVLTVIVLTVASETGVIEKIEVHIEEEQHGVKIQEKESGIKSQESGWDLYKVEGIR